MESGTLPAPDDPHRAARECRRVWRWHWQRYWILRWENALRRPSWRVEEEARAWRHMRDEVRRYAALRRSRRRDAVFAPGRGGIQKLLTTIRR
jgi:hypothetical protein